MLYLSEFSLQLVHKLGIQIIVVNTLSHKPNHAIGIKDDNNNLTMLPLYLFLKNNLLTS